jgi:VanZ family protein
MRKTRIAFSYWLPPLALMVLIFYLSSLSGLPDFRSFDIAMKKGAHLTVYAFLYLLLFRAFHSIRPEKGPPSSGIYALAALVAVLYAISDEVHQSFVPFRNATVRDVIIDSIGILLMYLVVRWKPSLLGRILRRPPASKR